MKTLVLLFLYLISWGHILGGIDSLPICTKSLYSAKIWTSDPTNMLCPGMPKKLTIKPLSSVKVPHTIYWKRDTTILNDKSLSISISDTGVYRALIVQNHARGKCLEWTDIIKITGHRSPKIIIVNDDQILRPNISKTLAVMPNPSYNKYRWEDGTTADAIETLMPGSTYCSVYHPNGCKDRVFSPILYPSGTTLEVFLLSSLAKPEDTFGIEIAIRHYDESVRELELEAYLPENIDLVGGIDFDPKTRRMSKKITVAAFDYINEPYCHDIPIRLKMKNTCFSKVAFRLIDVKTKEVVGQQVKKFWPQNYWRLITVPKFLNSCDSSNVTLMAFVHPPIIESKGDIRYIWRYHGQIASVSESNQYEAHRSGIYQVSVTHNGCDMISAPIPVSIGKFDRINHTQTLPNCGRQNGSIKVEPLNGFAPYKYLWSHNLDLNTNKVSNLSAGEYLVKIIDSLGCEYRDTFRLKSTSAPSIIVDSISHTTCKKGGAIFCHAIASDGNTYSIDYKLNGGNWQPYGKWNGLISGRHTIWVKDKQQCVNAQEIDIKHFSQNLTLRASLIHPKGNQKNGSIEVSVISDYVQRYRYQWSNGSHTAKTENLEEGTYNLKIIDENGCEHHRSYTLRSN